MKINYAATVVEVALNFRPPLKMKSIRSVCSTLGFQLQRSNNMRVNTQTHTNTNRIYWTSRLLQITSPKWNHNNNTNLQMKAEFHLNNHFCWAYIENHSLQNVLRKVSIYVVYFRPCRSVTVIDHWTVDVIIYMFIYTRKHTHKFEHSNTINRPIFVENNGM